MYCLCRTFAAGCAVNASPGDCSCPLSARRPSTRPIPRIMPIKWVCLRKPKATRVIMTLAGSVISHEPLLGELENILTSASSSVICYLFLTHVYVCAIVHTHLLATNKCILNLQQTSAYLEFATNKCAYLEFPHRHSWKKKCAYLEFPHRHSWNLGWMTQKTCPSCSRMAISSVNATSEPTLLTTAFLISLELLSVRGLAKYAWNKQSGSCSCLCTVLYKIMFP